MTLSSVLATMAFLLLLGAILILVSIKWLRKAAATTASATNAIPSAQPARIHEGPVRNKIAIFVSYNRKDELLVRSITALLRATDSSVFLDQDNIKPGRKWRVATGEALADCRTVLVFWCIHAAASEAVREEYEQGIELKKAIVPVLMDSTPLSSALHEYQWIDLREALGESHDSLIADLGRDIGVEPITAASGTLDALGTASRKLGFALDSLVTESEERLSVKDDGSA